jgi:hypothetical protein
MELTRQAMGVDNPQSEPQKPIDLGEALTQQFTLIDRNMEAVVKMVNAQNQSLKRTIQRQRIWNWSLASGVVMALVAALAAWR